MGIRVSALWFILLVLFEGCGSAPQATVETFKQESTFTNISTQTPLVFSTATPSATGNPIATPSTVVTLTTLPNPEASQTAQPACFSMLPALPGTKTYFGKIIFLKKGKYEYIQDSHYLASIYDLHTRQSMPMQPEKVNNIEVSPDGLNYAVDNVADGNVRFYSASGQLLRTLPDGEYLYGLDQWLSNERIALFDVQPWGESHKYPIDLIIYNPFSGEQIRMLSDQYPDIDQVKPRWMWERVSTTRYDPMMTRVIYPASIEKNVSRKSGIGYVLWDLEKQVKLAEIVTADFSVTPKWAPDGSRFAINDSYGDGEFYIVTRDGEVTQLSHLNSDTSTESQGRQYFSDLYSWSPDGRFLAFWLVSTLSSPFQSTLAILDTKTGRITDTCISAGFLGLGTPGQLFMQLIWSPDGKFLVTEANRKEDGSYQSLLIDVEGEYAAMLGENILPVGWLADMGQ